MQIFFRILLAIYLAHLLADFILQSSRLVERKLHRRLSGYLLHGLIHYVTSILLVGFFVRASAASSRTYLVLLALSAIHLLLDAAKIRLTARGLLRNDALAYASDQLIHFFTIVFAAWLLASGLALTQLFAFAGLSRAIQTKWFAVPIVYIGVIFGGGYLIRDLTRGMAESIKNQSPRESGEELQNAGLAVADRDGRVGHQQLERHRPPNDVGCADDHCTSATQDNARRFQQLHATVRRARTQQRILLPSAKLFF